MLYTHSDTSCVRAGGGVRGERDRFVHGKWVFGQPELFILVKMQV